MKFKSSGAFESFLRIIDDGKDRLFCEGDEIQSVCHVTTLRNMPAGQVVTGVATVSRAETPLVRIHSEFLIRGESPDYAHTFQTEETRTTMVQWTMSRNAKSL